MVKNLKIKNFLIESDNARYDFIKLLNDGYKYHIGGTSSCIDLMVVLFYGNFINLNKKKNSPFILSKGHALAALLIILMKKKLLSRREFENKTKNNLIGGQLDVYNLKNIDWNTGSLGHSIGVSIGFAIANPTKKVWTIVGDAEMEEGSVWEALIFISEKKIKNIIIIIDRNRISASSMIEKKEIFDNGILDKLDMDVCRIDGHNHREIYDNYNKSLKSKKSTIIIANTIKGKGFGIAENNITFNHATPSKKYIHEIKKIYEKKLSRQ